jgi:hypothetical protein
MQFNTSVGVKKSKNALGFGGRPSVDSPHRARSLAFYIGILLLLHIGTSIIPYNWAN